MLSECDLLMGLVSLAFIEGSTPIGALDRDKKIKTKDALFFVVTRSLEFDLGWWGFRFQ